MVVDSCYPCDRHVGVHFNFIYIYIYVIYIFIFIYACPLSLVYISVHIETLVYISVHIETLVYMNNRYSFRLFCFVHKHGGHVLCIELYIYLEAKANCQSKSEAKNGAFLDVSSRPLRGHPGCQSQDGQRNLNRPLAA